MAKKVDYIRRDEAINYAQWEGAYKVVMQLEEMKAADVQPVKHGRWIPQGGDMWLCSNCKENIIFSMHESDRTEKQRYCCRCGARMDGGIDG